MNNLLEAALKYYSMGYNVIPIGSDKNAIVKWKPFQKEKITDVQIKEWWTQWPEANIGIMTGKLAGLTVIDLDSEEALKNFENMIPETLLMPTATTPRGGQHRYFQYEEKFPTKAGILPGLDIRCDGGYIIAPPSRGQNGNGYAWSLGLELGAVPLPAIPSSFYNIIINSYIPPQGDDDTQKTPSPDVIKCHQRVTVDLTFGHRDQSFFHIAYCLLKGSMAEQDIELLLNIIALKCEPPYEKDQIPVKIASALKFAREKNVDVTEAIRELIMSSSGIITSSFVYQTLDLSSRVIKQVANNALHRFVKQGLIEKVPDKVSTFRIIEDDMEEIDFLHASNEEYPIKFPFGIERYVKIMPGNIIVIAGEVDAGKTAFCLNLAKLNMNHLEVHYFSCEMGAAELKGRLMKDDDEKIRMEDWKVKFWNRVDQFHDILRPDALNIIDYLEEPEEIYKVTARIMQIHKKLGKGIAIIALQKPKGRDEAVGGRGTLEKPRLYITLGRKEGQNIAKIIKAKNRKISMINPNGMVLRYNLIDGFKFIIKEDWKKGD